MPQMNYSEFVHLVNEIWEKENNAAKVELICTSLEYFFRTQFEKFGKGILVKPCMLLVDGLCKYYSCRPLNCRLYGLWPTETYTKRVDSFAKVYEGLLSRDELPLNTQCPFVKRVDDSKPLTNEIIDVLFRQLDDLDSKIGNFSDAQIKAKENYRTFHDWLLLKVFGEEWLSSLTTFMLGASKEIIIDQMEQLKKIVREKFIDQMPDVRKR
jgi:Fe-S-cluster containining protein